MKNSWNNWALEEAADRWVIFHNYRSQKRFKERKTEVETGRVVNYLRSYIMQKYAL